MLVSEVIPKMQCEGKGRAVKMKEALPRSAWSDDIATKYLLSSVAASIAETVTYPLDLTKTRLQVQGEWAAQRANNTAIVTPYRGMLQTAVGIVKEEGLRKLWQGVTPAIYRHIVYTGCRMAFYEWIRENILLKRTDGTFPVWKAILGGLFAGGFAQFLASPMDLIKVQMQTEGRRRLEGHAPRVKNTAHAFRQIVQASGVRGLWKGVVPNVQRAALVNLGDLTTYDTAKHLILKHTQMGDNMLTHASASGCSGLVAATMGTPADVIKTRVMNQPIKDGRGTLYKSSMDCLIKTVQMEGFWALYKGFLPCWIRMAPWSMTFWLSYEQIRRWVGVNPF